MRYYTQSIQSQASARSRIVIYVIANHFSSPVGQRQECTPTRPSPPPPFPVPRHEAGDVIGAAAGTTQTQGATSGPRSAEPWESSTCSCALWGTCKGHWLSSQRRGEEATWTAESCHGAVLGSFLTFRGLCVCVRNELYRLSR